MILTWVPLRQFQGNRWDCVLILFLPDVRSEINRSWIIGCSTLLCVCSGFHAIDTACMEDQLFLSNFLCCVFIINNSTLAFAALLGADFNNWSTRSRPPQRFVQADPGGGSQSLSPAPEFVLIAIFVPQICLAFYKLHCWSRQKCSPKHQNIWLPHW